MKTVNDEDEIINIKREYEKGLKEPKEGEIVQGRILTIEDDRVIVDVGYKSEGIVSLGEFAKGQAKIDDKVDLLLLKKNEENGK